MSVADELQKLEQLRQSGAIDDAEFAAAKARILSGSPPTAPLFANWNAAPTDLATQQEQTKLWALLLHLSLLAGHTVVPLAGLIIPIVIWQLKKDVLPDLDAHGKNAVNWMISELIYLAISIVLVFVFIGIPLLFVLYLLGIIFPIVAAIKANNGVIWKYPMTIEFLR